jgi:hypothetical protein
MAAPVALNAAFIRMGFSADAAVILAAADKENLTIESLQYMDDKTVETLCASLRKPGGMIDGPAPAGGAPIPQIRDPGVFVSTRAEMNMKTACYMARHYARTSRMLEAAMISEASIYEFKHKDSEMAYKEPTEPLKLKGPDKILDFIDEWPEQLALYNGQNGRPLSYILRDDEAVPLAANDPAFGTPNSIYGQPRDEIAARAAHGTPQFQVDNAKVFEMLNDAIGTHKHVKTWIKAFTRTKNGRGAWIAFKAHYRGSSELEAIEAAAEKALETAKYSGEKPRYNFETHVSKHLRAHLDIEKATGIAIAENTKVRKLLASIDCNMMVAAVAGIRAQAHLRNSFDETVNYMRAFILSSPSATRNVSSTETRKGGGGKKFSGSGGKGGKGAKNFTSKKNDDKGLVRFYSPGEWWKLDQDVRDRILALRAANKTKRKISAVDGTADGDDSDKEEETSQRSTKRVKFNTSK